jgi:pimeloyl-ACP methyl ester carboxylesterase
MEGREKKLAAIIDDFHSPFSGFLGSWRLMSLLRWGNPVEVLASVPAFLPQLPMPTVIFQGVRDMAVPVSFARRAAALIPNCEMVPVDAGHFIPLNNPERVAAELLRFFDPSRV